MTRILTRMYTVQTRLQKFQMGKRILLETELEALYVCCPQETMSEHFSNKELFLVPCSNYSFLLSSFILMGKKEKKEEKNILTVIYNI